ncbi:MAG: lycopene cyclase domain-containing protein [Bacteroidota bacterium]
MTYLQFHFVFILPVIFLLALVYRRTVAAAMKSYSLKWMFAVAGIALIYTTAWDNYLVYRGVWGYGPERVMATIGYVPIEEYMFFLLQPLLTGLFFYILVL